MKKHSILHILIGAFFAFNLNAQKVDLYQGLISSYEFDGNANDISGNGNHGVLHGPVLSTDRFGSPNNAYFFDGIDDYIEISPVSDVSNIGDFSIAVWANCYSWEAQPGITNNFLDLQYIFDGHSHSSTASNDYFREGFNIEYLLTPDFKEYIHNSVFYKVSNYYPISLNIQFGILNNWHHIVYIRNKSETFHYIDGVLLQVNNVSSSDVNMEHNWYIGTFSGNNPFYNSLNFNFYGKIDDIYIYNRAINACEVEALYSGNFPPER